MAAPYKGNLVFWRDLTPFPTPLHCPTERSPHVLIIGGGVIGLTNAWILLDHGYRVTVVSKEWASYGTTQRLTSQIAGALWEYPPAVCGQHSDATSLKDSNRWCMVAYYIFDAIATDKDLAERFGVKMRETHSFFPKPIEEDAVQVAKMLEIMNSGVKGFTQNAKGTAESGVNPTHGAIYAYTHLAPIIDTDIAMSFLASLVTSKGATLLTRTITGNLLFQESSLLTQYSASIILNCTGLAGTELAGDTTCYPIRGALLRVINDGTVFPKLEHALTIPAPIGAPETTKGNGSGIIFLVPRNNTILLAGGITEPHIPALDLTLSSPIIQRMRARCESFFPGLKNAKLDPKYPLAQGLRPFRGRNVRVEREDRVHARKERGRGSRIVHCYGHGGAGWSLGFGCAGDVLGVVEGILDDRASSPAAQRKESKRLE
ncbi:FAD dependent oxidoreductase [Setomelanomma holmii]|uniref:FAD dependent oxidoreductase n=1 Tax=Setomelanomma holmii TaxID=210430 RepID=A0A9P4H8I6_9PLEO|nr:FAD dependent oxidoreductase [Setomelanomma holmii]